MRECAEWANVRNEISRGWENKRMNELVDANDLTEKNRNVTRTGDYKISVVTVFCKGSICTLF